MDRTLTVRIDDELDRDLAEEARRLHLSKGEIVREALRAKLRKPRRTAYDALRPLIGIVRGGPPDVSTNSKYMAGFGAQAAPMKTILDTGPLVALMRADDRWHAWAVETLRSLNPPLLTCEPVLAEAAHLTRQPADVIAQVAAGALKVSISVANESMRIEALLRRYLGRMDLADACVVRLSELNPTAKVFTLDIKDFTVYRRNGRETIPLLAPER